MNTGKRSLIKRVALAAALACAAALLWIGWWNRARAAGPTPTPAPAPVPVIAQGEPQGVGFTRVGDWPWAGSGPSTPFGQGTYVDPGRSQHVPEYRLRVDDVVELLFRRTHEETGPYQLNVGDRLRVELPPSPVGGETLSREVVVQPDGNITLPLLGQVRAAGLPIEELTSSLREQSQKYYKP